MHVNLEAMSAVVALSVWNLLPVLGVLLHLLPCTTLNRFNHSSSSFCSFQLLWLILLVAEEGAWADPFCWLQGTCGDFHGGAITTSGEFAMASTATAVWGSTSGLASASTLQCSQPDELSIWIVYVKTFNFNGFLFLFFHSLRPFEGKEKHLYVDFFPQKNPGSVLCWWRGLVAWR